MTTKTGRPTILYQELIDNIVGWIRKGNSGLRAAMACGVRRSTYYYWLECGERDIEAGKEDSLYVHFLDTIKKEESLALCKAIARVYSGDKEWVSEMTWASRQHPNEWAETKRTELTVKEPISVEFKIIDKKT